jgi:hypothetical protein
LLLRAAIGLAGERLSLRIGLLLLRRPLQFRKPPARRLGVLTVGKFLQERLQFGDVGIAGRLETALLQLR